MPGFKVVKKSKKTSKVVKKVKKVAPAMKVPVVLPVPPPPSTKMVEVVVPESQKIWNEIKDLELFLYGLPGQTVAMHVVPQAVEPTKLYVVSKSSAVLPALEEAVKSKFNVELVDKFIAVSRVLPKF